MRNFYLKHRESLQNFFWRSLHVFGKQGMTFLIFVVSAKLLSANDLGVLTYVTSFMFLLILFSDFGLSSAVTKFAAEYNVTDRKKLRLLIPTGIAVILTLGIIISLLFFLFGSSFLGEYYRFALYLMPLIFLVPIVNLYEGVYMGLKKFKTISVIYLSHSFIAIILIYYLISKYGLTGAILANLVFYLLLFVSLAVTFREFDFRISKEIIRKVTSYSVILGLSALSFYLYARADIIVLGKWGYINEIASYEVLIKVFSIVFIPFTILGQIIGPDMSREFYSKNYAAIRRKYFNIAFFVLMISVLLSFIGYFAFHFGAGYVLSKFDLRIMSMILLGFIFLLPFRALGLLTNLGFITPTGKARIITLPLIIGGIANVILDLLLIDNHFMWVIYNTFIINIITILATNLMFQRELRNMGSNG